MIIGNDWDKILSDEWQKPYFKELSAFLDNEYQTQIIHPDRENVFKALELTSFADTKVVIIGQDPYHRENQAHGSAAKGSLLFQMLILQQLHIQQRCF